MPEAVVATGHALRGVLFYGLLAVAALSVTLVPFLHALKRGRWGWAFAIFVLLALGGIAYWITTIGSSGARD